MTGIFRMEGLTKIHATGWAKIPKKVQLNCGLTIDNSGPL